MLICALYYLIMCSESHDSQRDAVSRATVSRRSLLAAGGVVVAGSLAGCLNRVASSVTNTGASPAAVFAGERTEQFSSSEPYVRRLTPTLSAGVQGVSADVELEGWVTSTAVVAQDYNSSRSNKPRTRSSDDDADGDGVADAAEDDELLAYLGGEPVIGERFTVCLPDAEVPGGNGSIEEAVTPRRLVDYLTGNGSGIDRAWGGRISAASVGGGDCDDTGREAPPGLERVCERIEPLAADVTAPTATGGSLDVIRADDGTVLLINSPPGADGGPAAVRVDANGGADGPESSTEAIYQAWGGGKATPELAKVLVSRVMVQPPGCPDPLPGLLYVSRGVSDGQLVYSGGWVIDDAALYSDSLTVLTMEGAARVVPVDVGDLDGDGFGDAVSRLLPDERPRRGARIDTGTAESLVESGVLSAAGKKGYDHYVSTADTSASDGSTSDGGRGGRVTLTHLALDSPVLHLVNTGGASNEVKFKAGAELSGQVN